MRRPPEMKFYALMSSKSSPSPISRKRLTAKRIRAILEARLARFVQ